MRRLPWLLPFLVPTLALAGPVCPSASTPCGSEALCSGADILVCEDWEDGGHEGWSWNSGWTCASIANSGGHNSTDALKDFLDTNQAECAASDTQFTGQTGPVYFRFYWKVSDGYSFLNWTEQKVAYLKAVVNDNLTWRIMLGAISKSGDRSQGQLVLDALGHSPRWNYNGSGTQYLQDDTWYCIEFAIQANTVGQSDGWLRVWLDDVLYMEHLNQNLKNDGNPINYAWLSHYYGGDPPGNHAPMSLWYDDIVVSKARINCIAAGGGVSPPAHRVIVTN